ncbi:thiopurine S-methyltransferase family protein [Janthinobacterium sp. HH01]|uniref:methyltransferase domain-containing protein n=1 Tax=Janthinobacterium sp. HH01 TaxID=1198452 RepID=UPI0002AEB3A2|nr:methyltransferase domain-containing protein [Janthinobacterium sp. HH01]ELX12256.1 thiopurine S-methyltransferase family protein [Janthinobacterium sp. HH01]
MVDFAQRDPMSPAFWDERFERRFTPWDKGGVPQALREFAAASAPLATLIPGCGSAYELAFLADAGWDAVAIDFSPAAVAAGKAAVGAHAARVVEADFFSWQPARPLQLIYERAFLCALPRAMRPQVAARWAALLAPGALLAGYFFFDEAPKGPPFGIARSELQALLQADFECIADDAVSDSIAVFEGKERWMVWRRR